MQTKKNITSLNKEYEFTEQMKISEKFTTDFDSSYGIHLEFLNSNYNGFSDTILPIKIDLKILKNNKPMDLFSDYKKEYLIVNNIAQLSSFLSEENTEYTIKLNLKDNKVNQKKIKLDITTDVPGPSYELMFEREFKWVYWTMDGLIILLVLISGYFGFRKKASR